MQQRRLGNSNIYTAPPVLGGNVFGWTLDETTSFRILDEFLDAGFNFIDTADVYSRFVPGNAGGESENIIGKWMRGRGNRDRLVLATKVGMQMGPGKDSEGLSKAHIIRAAEDSLRRLQTDYIDLYQSHIDDAAVPLEETLGAYAQLIRDGKVRAGLVAPYLTPRGERILRVLDELAASLESSPASVALAWLIARPSVTAPIASATSSAQLRSLVDATRLRLDRAAIEALDRASA